ncbi:sodium-dependent glucose transporter 1-like isoform X1 [Bradysia coprophila]|uniref:sodium-dependent glucose transporter 1-like isoform X1 n=1 Tax=Bradysia coprophila TaxID=38358 RepID=UPI00187DB387|nr:sodium-dependent glucose transporter 1-like isoform X1 [Bradysia coprophila]
MAGDVKYEKRQNPQKALSKRVMHLTTSAILLCNISFGCSINAFAPALDNLASRYKTTIEDIAFVFTLVTISYCIGSIICGFLSKYVNRQLIVIISLLAMALSMFMTPYCPTKLLFFGCGGLFGFSSGFYGSSQIIWIIEIWQQNAGPFIQAQHFCFSLGTIIPSVVLAPFLDKDEHSHANATETALPEQSTIHTPFLIIGTFNSLALLYQLFLFIFYRYHTPPMYVDEKFEPLACAEDNPPPTETDVSGNVPLEESAQSHGNVKCGVSSRKIQLIAFAMLFVGAYQAMEISTMQFLPIFGQYSDLKLSESDAAHVLSGLMAMFATGRLVGIIIIFKVRPEFIVVVNLILIAAGNTILSVWASDSVSMFWIGSMILGAGFSTMFPSFFTFIEKHLIISGIFASCIMVVGTTTSSMYPIILGKVIEHQAVVLTYTNFASISVCVIVMFWGYYLTQTTVARE